MQHLRRLLCDAFHSYFAKFITKGRTHWGASCAQPLAICKGPKSGFNSKLQYRIQAKYGHREKPETHKTRAITLTKKFNIRLQSGSQLHDQKEKP